MRPDVRDRRLQDVGPVAEVAQPLVAAGAQHPADLAGEVVVVDVLGAVPAVATDLGLDADRAERKVLASMDVDAEAARIAFRDRDAALGDPVLDVRLTALWAFGEIEAHDSVDVVAPAGTRVARGDRLVVLEAMKMEHEILAPADGVLAELPVAVGTQVDAGSLLAAIEEAAP